MKSARKLQLNPKKEMQRRIGRARLTWEWKGGPPSGGDSLRSQLGRKLSTVARGRARGRPRGAGAADSDTWCPDPAPRRAAVRSPQEGGRSSLGQSAGAQSTPKGMMALGRVRGTGTSPFGEPRLRHSARARVRTRTQAHTRTRARRVQSGLAPLRASPRRVGCGARTALSGRRLVCFSGSARRGSVALCVPCFRVHRLENKAGRGRPRPCRW